MLHARSVASRKISQSPLESEQMTKSLFLFRHGETDWNREDRFHGHLDIPLNERGREQARALIPVLREAKVEALLSSDLQRTLQTAKVVADALGLPIQSDTRLREAMLGDAQGLTRDEIFERFGTELADRWRSIDPQDLHVRYPNGESGFEIQNRIFDCLEEKVEASKYSALGVATHGGVLRRIFQRLCPENQEAIPIPNGVLYILNYDTSTHQWSARNHSPWRKTS